jgi:hypothetical protein
MTRATLGTRVNPSGLVEDVALLGSEEVTDGNFPTPNTAWDLSPTFTIADNKLHCVSDGSYQYANQSAMVVGKTYRITFDITGWVSGNVRVRPSGQSPFQLAGSNGSYIFYYTAVSNSVLTIERNGTPTNLYIENISVKEATIDNLPRVDYTDGTSSLLVEPQRRNLLEYSESISNLSSNTNGTGTFTITDNYTDSPQGVQNASRVQMSIVDTDDTNNYRLINTGSVMTTGVTREISFYAKSLTGSNQDVLVYWSYDQQIVTLTNDWQRFKISATSGNTGSIFIGTRGGSGNYYSGGDGNLDFALWGLQVEDDGSGGGSSYATSYIKTSGSTVTRNQETYTKTGISDLINSEEGVLFVEMAALSDDVTERYISLSDGSLNNRVYIQFTTTTNQIKMGVTKGGSTQASRPETVSDVTEFNKLAISYSQDLFKFYVNGSLVFTDSSGDTFTANTLNRLNFDVGTSGFSKFFGKVRKLQVYKTTDIDLAALTS